MKNKKRNTLIYDYKISNKERKLTKKNERL